MATPFQDPLLSYQYSIEMAGGANTLATAWFTEISGIGAEQEIIEYKYYEKLPSAPTAMGGARSGDWVMLLPGRRKPGSITLKHGLTSDLSFWTWRETTMKTNPLTLIAKITIKMYDRAGSPKATWELYDGVLEKIAGPQLKADSSDYALEEMTIRYVGINRIL